MNDYLQTNNGDLDISNGDIHIVESTSQHQRDLLIADKGHIREKPQAGVGSINFLEDNDPENYLRTVRKEFAADGMIVQKIGITNSGINIDANYGSKS